jgi:UDP-N-acetylglucosamine transferase subunit ALG13
MIYLTVGTSPAPFNRLIAAVDRLVSESILREVVAQIGHATYLPEHLKCFRFAVDVEHLEFLRQADYVICHAGCATLDEGLSFRKKLVVVPRQVKWKEAPDDHQFDIARLLAKNNLALCAEDVADLERLVRQAETWSPETPGNFRRNCAADMITQYLDTMPD